VKQTFDSSCLNEDSGLLLIPQTCFMLYLLQHRNLREHQGRGEEDVLAESLCTDVYTHFVSSSKSDTFFSGKDQCYLNTQNMF
jgi:hypothetical protein